MNTSRVNSATLSFAIHSGTVLLLFVLSKAITPPITPPQFTKLEPLFAPSPRLLKSSAGAGGEQQALPATAGKLPPPSKLHIVPPTLQILNPAPKLAVAMSMEAPPEMASDFRTLGDPLAHLVNGSGGTGGPLGIGNGPGNSVGDKKGSGAGSGDDTGKVYRAGGGVTSPVLVHRVEPEFSEEARKAKYSGVVTIHADVDVTGHARNLRIVKSIGMGLDEKAIAAVSQWLFRPGTKDGKPVPVSAVIEVSFRLL